MYFYFDSDIWVAFDNDNAGRVAKDRFIKMAYNKYSKSVRELSFPYKDLNEFRCKSSSFCRLVKSQIGVSR